MRYIDFNKTASQKIYRDYLKRIERVTKTLPKADREEILMEFNSHIYEGTANNLDNNEIDNLLNVLEKLGEPEVVLIPFVADKKMQQATKTFNPVHLLQALTLNITNGVSYIIFSILYLFLFVFGFLIIAKLYNPETGMYFKNGRFQVLGIISDIDSSGYTEVLGHWFIPTMIIIMVILYFIITLLLKAKRSFNNKK